MCPLCHYGPQDALSHEPLLDFSIKWLSHLDSNCEIGITCGCWWERKSCVVVASLWNDVVKPCNKYFKRIIRKSGHVWQALDRCSRKDIAVVNSAATNYVMSLNMQAPFWGPGLNMRKSKLIKEAIWLRRNNQPISWLFGKEGVSGIGRRSSNWLLLKY